MGCLYTKTQTENFSVAFKEAPMAFNITRKSRLQPKMTLKENSETQDLQDAGVRLNRKTFKVFSVKMCGRQLELKILERN